MKNADLTEEVFKSKFLRKFPSRFTRNIPRRVTAKWTRSELEAACENLLDVHMRLYPLPSAGGTRHASATDVFNFFLQTERKRARNKSRALVLPLRDFNETDDNEVREWLSELGAPMAHLAMQFQVQSDGGQMCRACNVCSRCDTRVRP
eukprot:1622637-Rhodomonas_salina.2